MKKNKKQAGIIYSVRCEVTGEFYVGATTDSIERRKVDHIKRAKSGENQPFSKAIATHGIEAFNWEQTDSASTTNELARMEKEYIIKLNSKENGYNADSGGGIKKTVYQYDISDGSLIREYDCLESAASAVSAHKTSISNCCLGKTKSCKQFFWSYNLLLPFSKIGDLRKKKVFQLSHSGKQLAVYESVAEASRKSGILKSSIAKVCRGERNHAGGFNWSYK